MSYDSQATLLQSHFGVAGKAAVVTGGAAGIGLAVAELFLSLGADVILADRAHDACRLAASDLAARCTGSNRIVAVAANVTEQAEVEAMLDVALQAFGRLDVLVNCAGIYPLTPFDELKPETWDEVGAVNLKGTFLCVRAAGDRMKAVGAGGSIVNISSIGSKRPSVNHAAYGAAKAGVDHLTRVAALRYGRYGVRVNAVLPGVIDTQHARQTNFGRGPDAPDLDIAAHLPLRRLGHPRDIAQACLYFASEASAYVTGQLLAVDGGALAS